MTPKEPSKPILSSPTRSEHSARSNFPSQIDRDISNRLKFARMDQGLSVEEAANRVGIQIDIYRQLENLERRIDAWHLSKLAMALDLPIAWFFGQSASGGRAAASGRVPPVGGTARRPSKSDNRIDELRQRLDNLRLDRKR